MITKSIAATLFFLFATAASAQEMQQHAKCTGAPAALPAALSGWTAKTQLSSASDEARLKFATLAVGNAATLMLHPTRQVHYMTQPDKPGGSVAHGGLSEFSVASAGTYQVNLDSGAWIDVLKDGKTLESTAHAPGPACTGIRKTVQFVLQPGQYVLQISANANPNIAVMVSRVR